MGEQADTSFPFLPAGQGRKCAGDTALGLEDLPQDREWLTRGGRGEECGHRWPQEGAGAESHEGPEAGQAAPGACQLTTAWATGSERPRASSVRGPAWGPSEELASLVAHSRGAGTPSRSLIPLANNC